MTKRGEELLNDPILNRGTGFSVSERDHLGLHGLLPARVETLEQQVDRVVENCAAKPSDLERYIFLMALQDQNETLFYRTILKRLKDYMPLIYTPTVGEAALKYGSIFRRPRGLYITADDRGRVEAVLRNWADRDPRVIVATDGGRVLGLGDLGANRAVALQQARIDGEQGFLGVVAVSHKAEFEPRRTAGHIGQALRDPAPRARFGRREPRLARLQQLANTLRQSLQIGITRHGHLPDFPPEFHYKRRDYPAPCARR